MLKLKLADYSGPALSVFLVDGQYIRDNIYIDFTEGGNWLRYPQFIPEGEIWLGGIHIIECKFVLIHELAEVIYAAKNGLDTTQDADYSEAHDHANQIEQAVRAAPNTADEVIAEMLSQFPVMRGEE